SPGCRSQRRSRLSCAGRAQWSSRRISSAAPAKRNRQRRCRFRSPLLDGGRHSCRGRKSMKYKGYEAVITLEEDKGILSGEVINTRDVITFQGASVPDLKQAFKDSVDDYLEFCAERREEPEK